MVMALLLLSWMWDRVLTDCRGGPEHISYYYFQATIREVTLVPCTFTEWNPTGLCPRLVEARPVPFGPNIWDPGVGSTVLTWVDPVEDPDLLPEPPLGGLAAWPWPTRDNPNPVVAVDQAENRCTDVCPEIAEAEAKRRQRVMGKN